MVSPRLRALENIERVVSQIGAARTGMTGRGRVQSVDILAGSAVVLLYGRGGQTAKLSNVGIMGVSSAAEISRLPGEDVMLLFPSGKAGAGEAWILGIVTRAVALYDGLASEITDTAAIVDHSRPGRSTSATVELVSNIDTQNAREVTIAGLEVAVDSVENTAIRVLVESSRYYRSFTIPDGARRATDLSLGFIGSQAPIVVLAPDQAPFKMTIPANTSEDLTLTLRAARNNPQVTFGSYRSFGGAGAASGLVFSPKVGTREYPLLRIRGQVVSL